MVNTVRQLTRYLPEWAFRTRNKKPVSFNPAKSQDQLKPVAQTIYRVFDYDATHLEEKYFIDEEACKTYRDNGRITWINIDGLKKEEVERICQYFNVHSLVVEDILSTGQRAKMDEIGDIIFCLLPMLYFNDKAAQVETEQVSIVIGKDFLLSFQEDPERDVFDPVREKLKAGQLRLRQSGPDYLCYSLLDVIVDSYFGIVEKLNERIESMEDQLLMQKGERAIGRVTLLRREVMVLRRYIQPVRDLVNGFLKSENNLLEERNDKYYKDVYDHIIQANDYVENARDMLVNLQDLYMNQINLRMNQVMKTFTMVALLLAPATVIGGIFGMNFEVIPLLHQAAGFYVSVGAMLIIPAFMLIYFKRKGWF